MSKLVIFDWDGTLCDSLSRIALCMQLAAKDLQIAPPSDLQVHEIVGLGLGEAFQQLYPQASNQLVDQLKHCYSKHFVERDSNPSPFYEGVEAVLQRLKDNGLLIAVATGKSRRGLDRVLGNRGLRGFFDASRCADETQSKPHPQMLHELLDEFSLQPKDALMIGDTEFDMAMAQRAEMPRLGVSYGAHSIERLQKYQLNYRADHFYGVEQAIEQWSEC